MASLDAAAGGGSAGIAGAAAAAGSAGQPRDEVAYVPIEQQHVPALRALFGAILPVRLHDQMYRDAVACGDVSQLAFYHPPAPPATAATASSAPAAEQPPPELIGALLARLEAAPGGKGRLYIAALAVAAPFRGRGIASELLRRSVAAVADDPAVFEAYLHVRASAAALAREAEAGAGAAAGATAAAATTAAEGARGGGGEQADGEEEHAAAVRRWYAARGFSAAGVVEGYYARLPPPCDALVMRRPLGGLERDEPPRD